MTNPKFKIGDRVKWEDYVGRARSGVIVETPCGRNTEKFRSHYVKEAQELPPGRWHESHLSLDVPETPKFKIGDRVKWDQWGRIGVIAEVHADNRYSLETTWGCLAKFPGAVLSLDVPEPKQFATKLEAELGAEIIRLNFQILDQRKENAFAVSRTAAEVVNVHRERFAKEAAQKELAEANDKIKRLKTFIGLL